MRKEVLLQNLLDKSLSFMHKSRKKVLLSAVNTVVGGAKLTLTDIGRNICGKAKERN